MLLVLLLVFISPFFKYVPRLVDTSSAFLFGNLSEIKQDEGRTNFLILGLGGPKNEPSGLTDTIIFFSYDHKNNQHLLLSIPRDIWIPQMRAKLNTAYYYGNQTDGLGSEWIKKYTEEIVGKKIQYTSVISYDGFVKIIDQLGGVEVQIDRTFTDNKYPIEGRENDLCNGDTTLSCRWESITFTQGLQNLNGELALKFVRSRHAESEDGTDFARAQRQQKVILALKEALLKPNFLLNPQKIDELLKLITNSLETNLDQKSIGVLAKSLLNLDKSKIKTKVLEEPILLTHPPISRTVEFQWVLVPSVGDWSQVHSWVDCLLTSMECEIAPAPLP